MNTPSRRQFLKASGASAFLIAQSGVIRSYAANDRIQIGIVGAGSQASHQMRTGLAALDDFKIIGVADVFEPNQKSGCIYAELANSGTQVPLGQPLPPSTSQSANRPEGFYDYRVMLERLGKRIDALYIGTPPHTHHEIAMAGLDAGKWIFCEKPLASSVEGSREIVDMCHKTGRSVLVFHEGRYTQHYNRAMYMAHDQKMLGRITHVSGMWHRSSSWRRHWEEEYKAPDGTPYALNDEEKKHIPDLERHLNWRLYRETSGGPLTELGSYSIDVANWFTQSYPRRVFVSEGLDHWRDGRTTGDNAVLVMEFELAPETPGFLEKHREHGPVNRPPQAAQQDNSAYGVRLDFTTCLDSSSWPGAYSVVHGELGAFRLALNEGRMFFDTRFPEFIPAMGNSYQESFARKLRDTGIIVSSGSPASPVLSKAAQDGYVLEGDTDQNPANACAFRDFAACIRSGARPRVSEMDGHILAVSLASAKQSAEERRPVDIDPALFHFDFDTPATGVFDFQPSA